MFTLTQLRCFLAVSEDLNVRRAARRLNMTQPPLTRHLQTLEHEVGTPLLDRSRRAISLTPAGVTFARAAQRLLDQAADATRDARRVGGGDAGSITIAFTAASSYGFVPNLIAQIRRLLPELALTLRELTTPQQIAALKAEQVDLCFLRPPVSLPGIHTMRVFRERLVLAVPCGHELAGRTEIAIAELATQTLITYPPVEGPYFHGLVMGLMHASGISPSSIQFITQTHSILALVDAGLGVAIVPQAAERCLPARVALRPIIEAEGLHVDLLLAWPANTTNRACAMVLDLIRQGERQVAEP